MDKKKITVQEIVEQCSNTLARNVKVYMGAYEVKTQKDFVEMMRKLGGFTEMTRTVIGPQPPALPNAIGMPENLDWYIWDIKDRLKGYIIETAKLKLQIEQVEQAQHA